MTDEPRHRTYDLTLSEWIATIPSELPDDAVGLWQIVPAGRMGFGLEGEALTDFVRRGVDALLAAGAIPVVGSMEHGGWHAQPQYGATRDAIREAVVAQWLAEGAPDPSPGGLWFARDSPRTPVFHDSDVRYAAEPDWKKGFGPASL